MRVWHIYFDIKFCLFFLVEILRNCYYTSSYYFRSIFYFFFICWPSIWKKNITTLLAISSYWNQCSNKGKAKQCHKSIRSMRYRWVNTWPKMKMNWIFVLYSKCSNDRFHLFWLNNQVPVISGVHDTGSKKKGGWFDQRVTS